MNFLRNINQKLNSILLTNFFFLFISEKIFSHTEKQRYDGWYNNLAHPDWGAVGEFFFVVVDFIEVV
jgi:tryptophan-rich sensory protein